jgi:hypothetical protein
VILGTRGGHGAGCGAEGGGEREGGLEREWHVRVGEAAAAGALCERRLAALPPQPWARASHPLPLVPVPGGLAQPGAATAAPLRRPTKRLSGPVSPGLMG